jgi:hypothetical protein
MKALGMGWRRRQMTPGCYMNDTHGNWKFECIYMLPLEDAGLVASATTSI